MGGKESKPDPPRWQNTERNTEEQNKPKPKPDPPSWQNTERNTEEQNKPKPKPEFAEPWRKMKWEEKQVLENKLRNLKITHPDVQQVRIVLVGPVGGGKSSFINSVNSVFQGRITCETISDSIAGRSCTKIYKPHYIEGEDGKPLAFLFNDVMGLEGEHGAHEEDIVKALKGFVQDGYKFNPESPISTDDQHYRNNPDLKNHVFCLLFVLPADKVSLMNSNVLEKMKLIRQNAITLNMPQVIIMTKPDEACPLVKEDLRKIYTSKKIKDKMQECSNLVGVPMSHIFPVKNYHEEMDTEDDIDVLILKALCHIVNIANDFLRKEHSGTSDRCE